MRIPTIRGRISCNLATDFEGVDPGSSCEQKRRYGKLATLKPHETCQDTVEVSYLYDVVRPRPYNVQLEPDLLLERAKAL